jgi:hypothetical protein
MPCINNSTKVLSQFAVHYLFLPRYHYIFIFIWDFEIFSSLYYEYMTVFFNILLTHP